MKKSRNREGVRLSQSVEDYIAFLEGKGFSFPEDAMGFIYFGKQYANADDFLVNMAIEITLKVQKQFDGSFYISLLENFKQNKVQSKVEAERFVKTQGLLL